MIRSLATAILSLSVLVSAGCTTIVKQEPCPVCQVRFDNVAAVFMHKPGHYSILYAKPDSKVLHPVDFGLYGWVEDCYRCHVGWVEIVADVAAGQPMWAEAKNHDSQSVVPRCYLDVRIHVHGGTDVRGGGWRSGDKFGGSGQTNVVDAD